MSNLGAVIASQQLSMEVQVNRAIRVAHFILGAWAGTRKYITHDTGAKIIHVAVALSF